MDKDQVKKLILLVRYADAMAVVIEEHISDEDALRLVDEYREFRRVKDGDPDGTVVDLN